MTRSRCLPLLLCTSTILLALSTGCLRGKPAVESTRFLVLTGPPEFSSSSSRPRPDKPIGIGIAPVIVPDYLADDRVVIRQGDNELGYVYGCRWAERLDRGLQRLLASELEKALPAAVFTTATRREDVQFRLSVTFRQAEVSTEGKARVAARWEWAYGDPPSKRFGEGVAEQNGPAPETDPAGAVAVLAKAVAGLVEQIAKDLPPQPGGK